MFSPPKLSDHFVGTVLYLSKVMSQRGGMSFHCRDQGTAVETALQAVAEIGIEFKRYVETADGGEFVNFIFGTCLRRTEESPSFRPADRGDG